MSAESLPADKLVGQVLANRYEILHRLGEGAMGVVYKARHVKVGRMFAVKVLHTRLLVDPKVAQRFAREAELAGRLRHPNVIGVVDVGELDDMHYMVMDFAEGPDLATLLSEAPMPPSRITRLVRAMLEGLYHAHEQGLIHRDFKPENVIIEKDTHGNETPRIVDFGIALLREGGDSSDSAGRLTTNGLVLGTPHYMAPEQAVADPIDHRIDLFALGIVVYEMLSGRLPFDGSGAEVARANLLLDPPAISTRVPYLEVDPLLEAFARRLMAKQREQRPATANAARELLDLIERDRRAAGAELGVSPEMSERAPAVTQPVQRQARIATPDPHTVSLRKTPPPASAADLAVARWAGIDSEPMSGAVSAMTDEATSAPARAAGPAWTPGPPVLYAPPTQPQPELDRETAMRTPLDWPAAPPPRRKAPWIAAGVGLGISALALGWVILTREPAHTPPTTPAPQVAVAPEAKVEAPVEAKPEPVEAKPEPVEAKPEPVADPAIELETPAPPKPRPVTVAPVPRKPAVVVARPDKPDVKPETKPVPVAETPKPEPRPEPRPEIKPEPKHDPKPDTSTKLDPKAVAAKCDTAIPPVEGISPAAVSELYTRKVPAAINAATGDKSDLWARMTRYNINELMAAPQDQRDDAARALWKIVKDAGCRK